MTVTVRFAPSPTGLLHVGNARTALVTCLFARQHRGTFLLRLDDTDLDRSSEMFAEAIEGDLAWLGLTWDRRVRQSDRLSRYESAAELLKADGRLYPCYETPEELALKRTVQLQRHQPPIYDRAALALTDSDRRRLKAEGRRPHWRFKLDHEPIEWHDHVRGPVRFHGRDLSDPVVIREDRRPLYHLSSVIDDADFGITDVVRGEDHVANTAAHVQMFRALGVEPPRFAHLPLIADAEGRGLSKREGSLSIRALREDEGVEAMAINSLLARLGTSDPVEPVIGLDALIAGFSWRKFGRATPRFDLDELSRLNARLLHELPYETVASRIAAMGAGAVDEAFWAAVRPNLTRLSDLRDWIAITRGEIEPVIVEPDLTGRAASMLPQEPWTENTWSAWTGAVKQATGIGGKALFRPLRLALTGREHGPELRTLLPLIGRHRATARLRGEAA